MRYCYCPECDKFRPRNWYSRGRCEICKGRCVDVEVKRTIYGYLMYLLDAVAVVFIAIYLFADFLTGGLGDLVHSIGLEVVAIIMFALIGGSLVLGYLDLKETTLKAEAKVIEIKRKRLESETLASTPDLEVEDQGNS